MEVSFLINVENTLNPLIILRYYPEGFSNEEMLGRIWLNKDDLDVLFNRQINLKIMNSWFDFISDLFKDTISTCLWVTSLHNWLFVSVPLYVTLCVTILPLWSMFFDITLSEACSSTRNFWRREYMLDLLLQLYYKKSILIVINSTKILNLTWFRPKQIQMNIRW